MDKLKMAFILLVLGLIGLGVFQFRNVSISDDEIRKKFECDRLTKDARQTDYYCQNPNAYRMGQPIPVNYH